MTKVMARRDTMTTAMAMDVNDDDDKGDDASLTMCSNGDNHNRNDSEDSCASTATTPAHWRRQRHSQSCDGNTSRGRGDAKKGDATTSWCKQIGGVEDGGMQRLCDER